MINKELLEALKDLYVLVQVTPSVLPQLLKAEAAIARAESAVSEPSIDKITHCHTKMRLFDFEQNPDHEFEGLPHRPYASGYGEGCYLCATLAEIKRLQAAAAVSEPVAWLHKDGHVQVNFEGLSKRHADEYTAHKDWTPLYATPPAAPLPEPLTDEQIDKVWAKKARDISRDRAHVLARAIENAHNIGAKE